MRTSWLAVVVPGVLAAVVGVFVLVLLLVKVMWAWTVPDLFPKLQQLDQVIARALMSTDDP